MGQRMIQFLRPESLRHLLFFAFFLASVLRVQAVSIGTQMSLAQRQVLQREARLVVDLLQNHHFSGRALRELESKAMVSRFIEDLDPQAEFLDDADHESLHRRFDRTLKSVYLFRGDLQPAFEIFDLFTARADERLQWVRRRLDRGFDFTDSETRRDRVKPVPFSTRAEADLYWELLLKERVLVEILRGRTNAEAEEEVRRQYARIQRTIMAYDALAVRERFLDAIIRSYDAHSGYFSADSTREFAVEMEKSVVGVGLNLRKEDGSCLVESLQRGGPAELGDEIQPGDVLEAVTGEDGVWHELGALRLREIVSLLRGAVGTRLQIAYRPAGESARRVTSLERRRVDLGSERAHGAVCEVPSGSSSRRIGWIMLPNFYAAGPDSKDSSATRDVRELLGTMGTQPLDGLVIDLRTNPGGALTEAAALSELFLPGGVMMLTRGLDGKVTAYPLKQGTPLYTGPLVVLVSPGSASASEVFAGAMKYHRRALVVGAPATFGKGTVQNYLDLAKVPGGQPDWGTLRLTRERFYLPDGNSVQASGVTGDISFPGVEAPGKSRREADLPGSLPAETVPAPPGIRPATLVGAHLTDDLKEQLRGFATANLQALPEWELVRDAETIQARNRQEIERSLQQASRQRTWDEQTESMLAWSLRQRQLAQTLAYPTQAHDTKERSDTLSSEDERLGRRQAGEPAARPRLHQGAFVMQTAAGHWRKVRLDSFDFPRRVAEAATLATRLGQATNHTVAPETMKSFLQHAALLEHVTAPALLKAVGPLTGADASPESRLLLLEYLLLEITRLDDSFRQERAPLDVPLREAMRLTARWAESLPTSASP